jgi:glycosyltransferase involved in cell wall biosynthesis
MAVHNGAPFVQESVASILAQSYSDFELVVVDDASTDGSGEIIDALNDPRTRILRNDHQLGLTRSLNRGLSGSSGLLVARQDADDVSHRDRLTLQVEYLDSHPETGVVGAWYRKIGATGELLGERELPTTPVQLAWAMLFYCPLVHSAAVFRRADVAAVSGYDERFTYAQDYDLWSRLGRRLSLANLPRTLVDYRQGPSTMTARIGASSDEVLRIAGRNIQELGGQFPTAEEHRLMGRVSVGDCSSLAPNEIRQSVQAVSSLLDRFVASGRFGAEETAELRAHVERTMDDCSRPSWLKRVRSAVRS